MAFRYRERSTAELDKRAEQQGGDFQGFILDEFKTWSPKKGDNWVRILPPTWDEPTHYGMDVWVHYGIGPDRASLVCVAKQPHPVTGAKGHCAVCEARARAEASGDDELASELKPSRRVLVWLLDMREQDKGPQIWAMPWTVDRDVVKISRDKRTGEVYVIDHPDHGYDLMFDKEGDKQQTKYVGLQLARRPSSVDTSHLDFIEGAPLPFTLRWRDDEEVAELFRGAGMESNRGGGRDRDDRREPPPRDDRRDDRREPPRDDRRDPPPRDDRREPPPRDEPPREERREPPPRRPIGTPPREEHREPPRDEPPPPRERDYDHPAPPRDDPPFDGGRPAARPSTAGATTSAADRAAALRAKFQK